MTEKGKNDWIIRVEIDSEGRLRVKPSEQTFPHIWRAAMEVNWDPDSGTLFGPRPREWTYPMWFQQIVAAAWDEYGVRLFLSASTTWLNVPAGIQAEIARLPSWL